MVLIYEFLLYICVRVVYTRYALSLTKLNNKYKITTQIVKHYIYEHHHWILSLKNPYSDNTFHFYFIIMLKYFN